MPLIRTFARHALSASFIIAGIDAVTRPETHRARISEFDTVIEKIGGALPSDAELDLLTKSSGTAMILAGSALALGKFPRTCGAVLFALQVPIAFANNPFWKKQGADKYRDLLGLSAGIGLAAGALAVAESAEKDHAKEKN